jgi:hypothetical protein
MFILGLYGVPFSGVEEAAGEGFPASLGGGEGGSAAGGAVLMVKMVQPIQKPMARTPRNPIITGIARAQ